MLLVVVIVAVAVVVALLLWRASTVTLLLALIVLLLLLLVTRVAKGVAAQGSEAGTNRGTFQTTTTLIADDATDGGTAQRTQNGACLSVRAGGAGNQRKGGQCCEETFFHIEVNGWNESDEFGLIVVTTATVTGIADRIATQGSERTANGCAFEATAAL